jgi:hypothetical protein
MTVNKQGSEDRDKPRFGPVLGLIGDRDYTGLLIGLVIIGLGVALLLDQEGVVRVWEVWRFWPLVLVGVGLVRLLRARCTPDRMWGMVEILFGAVFQLGALGYQRFEFSRTWPLLVIGAGLWVLYGKLPWPGRSKGGDATQSTLDFNRADVFGGGKVRVTSKNFRGGKWLAVIGGSQVDFTGANMEGNEATLNIVAVFGGGEIIVPRNWEVQVQGMAFFGGHNDETQPPLEASDPRKKLIITGAWVFGGFNVRN